MGSGVWNEFILWMNIADSGSRDVVKQSKTNQNEGNSIMQVKFTWRKGKVFDLELLSFDWVR